MDVQGAGPQLEEQVRREARTSGLHDFVTPSLEAVERRRLQLWAVAIVILAGLTAATSTLALWPDLPRPAPWINPRVLGLIALLVTVGFGAYAVEKERALGRLTALLMDERVLTAALSNRLKEVSALMAAGRAVNSVLALQDVLDIILGSALELLHGDQASIMLVDGPRHLRVVCSRGNGHAEGARVALGTGISGQVALSRHPRLIVGPSEPHQYARDIAPNSAMCVPLIHRDELLGVLNVASLGDRMFSEYDLRAVTLFAEHAAVSIANGRLFDAESRRVAELVELNRMKSDFVAAVSHELRTPLTSILGSARTMRSLDLGESQRDEFLDMIERQGNRLLRLIEEILTTAHLDARPSARLERVEFELPELVRTVASDLALGPDRLIVDVPRSCPVLGNADLFHQILLNLIDNATKHGAPPVRVHLEEGQDAVMLSVIDAGPGIPRKERERIFDRFTRLEWNGHSPGIGLGLAIVRQLVEACGGRVWVEDAPGGGAAFRVQIPVDVPVGAMGGDGMLLQRGGPR
jgi:two-component system sensor histidine kinase KdpD